MYENEKRGGGREREKANICPYCTCLFTGILETEKKLNSSRWSSLMWKTGLQRFFAFVVLFFHLRHPRI